MLRGEVLLLIPFFCYVRKFLTDRHVLGNGGDDPFILQRQVPIGQEYTDNVSCILPLGLVCLIFYLAYCAEYIASSFMLSHKVI